MSTVEPIRSIADLEKIETLLYKNKRNLLLFLYGINLGLRISDILALNVKDVKGKNFIRIREIKTGKLKIIPLNSKLKPLTEEYIKGKKSSEPLFKTVYNNRMDRFTAYHIIKAVCKKAGIEAKIGTHTLRKTFGYHHYKKFKDIALLQKIFNHSSMQITLRYIGIEQEEIFDSYNNFVL